MHTHKWKYNRKAEEWRCKCGEFVTVQQFIHAYGRLGNLDVVPAQGIELIVARRQQKYVQRDLRPKQSA